MSHKSSLALGTLVVTLIVTSSLSISGREQSLGQDVVVELPDRHEMVKVRWKVTALSGVSPHDKVVEQRAVALVPTALGMVRGGRPGQTLTDPDAVHVYIAEAVDKKLIVLKSEVLAAIQKLGGESGLTADRLSRLKSEIIAALKKEELADLEESIRLKVKSELSQDPEFRESLKREIIAEMRKGAQ
jgi:hypothetical protein